MSDCLNVIALISGGKDSLFSLLHCVENGHKIVALANLFPPSQANTGDSPKNVYESSNAKQHSTDLQDVHDEASDLNSFMYQTVGHSLIPLYSTVLQLPLYRSQISGSSVQQSQYYDTSSLYHSDMQLSSDETEDLVPLLRQIISAHPEANALSSGAILSTYQRTRVESIATRLGLTPLSYLWQYPALPPPHESTDSAPPHGCQRSDSLTGLLEDMASSGMDARIIKIASAGIPEGLLLANVTDARTRSRLINGLSPFFEEDDEMNLRGAVLGEGGEYETIALSGPREIWKGGRIELDEAADQTYVEEGVSYVRFGRARVVPHDEQDTEPGITHSAQTSSATNFVPFPALLDRQFDCVHEELKCLDFDVGDHTLNDPGRYGDQVRRTIHSQPDSELSYTITSQTVTLNNLTSRSISKYSVIETGTTDTAAILDTTAVEQMQTILSHLPSLLNHLSQTYHLPVLSTSNITSTTVLLESMSDFMSVNPIYSQIYLIGLPNPPARVTLAAPLPQAIRISLSLTLDLCPQNLRKGLHVQGRSYWAPANIGPYSQAIAVPLCGKLRPPGAKPGQQDDDALDKSPRQDLELVHIAGQIPLVPASMAVFSGSTLNTTILSLQHLWRVGQERNVDIWPWGVSYLSQNNVVGTTSRANAAVAVWQQAHLTSSWTRLDEDDEGKHSDSESLDGDSALDVWDMQRNHSLYDGFRRSKITMGRHLHLLPNHALFHDADGGRRKQVPPFIAAEVNNLPRNASIEWWSQGIAGLAKARSSQSIIDLTWRNKVYDWGSLSVLQVTPDMMSPKSSTMFISYMVDAREVNENATVPATLSELMHIAMGEPTSVVAPSNATIVSGTALVTTSALNSGLWSGLTDTPVSIRTASKESSIQYEQVSPNLSNYVSSTQLLSNQVSIVPCHRLWGKAATSMMQSRPVDRGNFTAVSELALVFLLRIDTTSGT